MSCAAHKLAASRGMLRLEDVDLIRELTALLPADAHVYDLGAGSGTTALSVLAQRWDVSVTTWDIEAEAVDWARKAVLAADAFAEREGRWRGGVLNSTHIPAPHWEKCHLLLIDTSHEYEATVEELRLWLPLLAPGGFVWLHDYEGDAGLPEGQAGVKGAVDEAVERGELICVAQRGLGWAGRKRSG